MVEALLIDLKALLVEREDCDAGTVTKLREGLAQGKTQYRTLREVTETLKKRAEAATGTAARNGTSSWASPLFSSVISATRSSTSRKLKAPWPVSTWAGL